MECYERRREDLEKTVQFTQRLRVHDHLLFRLSHERSMEINLNLFMIRYILSCMGM